jgi:hypothetical protein
MVSEWFRMVSEMGQEVGERGARRGNGAMMHDQGAGPCKRRTEGQNRRIVCAVMQATNRRVYVITPIIRIC